MAGRSADAAAPPAIEARHGMVVSAQQLASQAGLAILQAGGNAIDAAVAVGYALAVVNPWCGNIGGGDFMMIHLAAGPNGPHDTFINFRETALGGASPKMYLEAHGKVVKDQSLYGYRAAGVPGTVMGLDRALGEYSTLSRAAVMAPAIRLAREGFVLRRADADILDKKVARFGRDPVAARIFLRPDGTPLQPGDRLVQQDLAATLALIAQHGPDAFYKGPIARAVARASTAHGGLLSEADFARYTVTEGAPTSCIYSIERAVLAGTDQ